MNTMNQLKEILVRQVTNRLKLHVTSLVLRYFPIIPRLQRLYKSSHTAKDMIWHATGKCTEPGKMQHPVDGGAWKKFDTKYPDFAKEPRNVRLGLAADGFNPFGNLSQAYSMWPVILTTYNLPPWLCMKESSFMLTLLIPGPKSPGKDIDVYLRPLIEDLKVLWDRKGVETIDVASGQKFNMRAMVLWTINDFPARSSLLGGCGRRSLEFNGQTDNTDPPKEFGRDVILAQLDRLPTRVKGKHPSHGGVKIKRNVHVELNWTKRPILNSLLMNGTSKDTAKARQDLQMDGHRSGFPEIDTYRSQFKSLFPNKDMQEEFPDWFGSQDLNVLANGPSWTPISINSCVVDGMSADVARSHGGDGGGDDRPPSHVVPTGCGGCFAIELALLFVPLYYPSWEKVPKERKAAIISEIGTLFDLRPHMDSSRWTEIYEGINMHLQKAYNTNKASFKAKHWKADPTTGTYDVEAIRRARPEEITAAEWDKYIKFWNDPKNLARAAQNRLNRQKSVVISRQGSRSLARLRDEMRQASDTQEYPSLIDTFWRTHTVDGVFPKDEDRRIYEEMKRLEATGEYTEDEINALARGGKLRGHIPGVGRVLPSRATSRPSMSAPVDKSLKSMHRKVDFMMSLFRSDNKYADMFKEFESGGASGSGGCGDDEESGDDEDDDGER
ncbi:hypothetical protein Tco_0105727 [Tanacetum coccineum]